MKDDGGPAFPQTLPKIAVSPDEALAIIKSCRGATLRDYFSGQMLAGVISNSEFKRDRKLLDSTMPDDAQIAAIAALCYQYADAMIAERSKD